MSQISIYTIADLCAKHGVTQAIISPGSRNAPLTIAFNRHPEIQCYSISDERSAAFIALGMAQASRKTVAIICTSGSAALNYAPAVAEAYFQEVPLLVLTADRPPEWIDQWDGQTIRQQNIYGRHVKESYQLPIIGEHPDEAWQAYRMLNEACIKSISGTKGPVHLNIPFREPFYPEVGYEPHIDPAAKKIDYLESSYSLESNQQQELKQQLSSFQKVAFLLGQDQYDDDFLQLLDRVSQALNVPIFADIISNGHNLKNAMTLTDAACMRIKGEITDHVQPQLLISFGKSIISKNLKLFLRNSATQQWHISASKENIADPFQALSKMIHCQPASFLTAIETTPKKADAFLNEWKSLQSSVDKLGQQYLSSSLAWNEFSALNKVIAEIPAGAHIHLANSLSVRYANFIGLQKTHTVWCNRGTSGIDGSSSTSMGHAIVNTDKRHYLITGDVAFFYDRNAFWHNYPYQNLTIILINNQGGSIFRMIKGPKEQKELEEFFETKQQLNASALCQEFGIAYQPVSSYAALDKTLAGWIKTSGASLVEIQSNSQVNQKIFESFKKHIQN